MQADHLIGSSFTILRLFDPLSLMTEKEKFIREFNHAFSIGDTDYLSANVTEDVVWNMVGDEILSGKTAFLNKIREMGENIDLEIEVQRIISHGIDVALEGTIAFNFHKGKRQNFSFCDIYKFSGFKNPKIKNINSYIIETKE
jgi:predicted ester cyclase